MNKLTVVVIVLFAIAAAAYIIYRIVKAKLRELSRAAFGTDSFAEGWKRQTEELAATPKSVDVYKRQEIR